MNEIPYAVRAQTRTTVTTFTSYQMMKEIWRRGCEQRNDHLTKIMENGA